MKLGFYWLFKIERKLVIQNGDLQWLNRSQNFDFKIAISFLFLSDLDRVCGRMHGLKRYIRSAFWQRQFYLGRRHFSTFLGCDVTQKRKHRIDSCMLFIHLCFHFIDSSVENN